MGMAKEMIECSLCGMQFNEKRIKIMEIIKQTHERWHTNRNTEKRNTTEGKVEWI